MPKEVVVRPEERGLPPVYIDDGTPPGSPVEPMHGLSVGWNKSGWVQIHMFPHDWESTGDWTIVDLERPAINHLIRVLRKARDQAYGADA